jgi:putative alpha-1,2-mannosidase
VSLISSAQACANAEEEIPDFDFEKVRADSRKQWNELLGRVQVDMTGVDKETVQLFYSSVSVLGRSHIPSRLTHWYLGFSFTGHTFLQPIVCIASSHTCVSFRIDNLLSLPFQRYG